MSWRTIFAEIRLLTTEAGGRSEPLFSGYRSLLRFERTDVDYGFELTLDSEIAWEGIAPGSAGTARILFWTTDVLPRLLDGQMFEVREGAQIVGYGLVAES